MPYRIPPWRRDEINARLLHVLKKSCTKMLPVELRSILDHFGYRVTSIRKAREAGANIRYAASGLTVTRFNPPDNEYLIIYNNHQPLDRIRWTISHEIGHIVLGHLTGAPTFTDMESEANYFAREPLAPLAVLDELDIRSASKIAEVCEISKIAAKYIAEGFRWRDRDKARHGNSAYDLHLLKQYEGMFNMELSVEITFSLVA
jgi:hypothetical protein